MKMMNSVFKMMNCVFKMVNSFCISNDEFCIKVVDPLAELRAIREAKAALRMRADEMRCDFRLIFD